MPALVKSLRALSDPTRLRLLLLLIEEEVTVAELQEILGMGQSRISASLSLLKREGLTAARRVGKNIFYSSRPEMVEAIRPILDAASRELPEASRDSAALALTLHKRKDKAAEYFNKLAGKFGRTYIPGRSWQALAHGLLRLLPPMVIADLGAGEGTLSQLLARSARHVIAIDNSEKMVEYAVLWPGIMALKTSSTASATSRTRRSIPAAWTSPFSARRCITRPVRPVP